METNVMDSSVGMQMTQPQQQMQSQQQVRILSF